MTAGVGTTGEDRLALADWRRRVADLYAEVRRLASADPEGAWRLWRDTRERLFREHPQSPVPPAARPSFRALHWPYDERLRFALPVHTEAAAPPGDPQLQLPMSVGDGPDFKRVGWVEIPFEGGPRRLGLFWMAGYVGGLFLPFRDATNGGPTYGAGRYLLDTGKSADLGTDADGRLIIDFNFAYHPSCAFDPTWSCPLAPPENRLDLPIEAGERLT